MTQNNDNLVAIGNAIDSVFMAEEKRYAQTIEALLAGRLDMTAAAATRVGAQLRLRIVREIRGELIKILATDAAAGGWLDDDAS